MYLNDQRLQTHTKENTVEKFTSICDTDDEGWDTKSE
jgi:hypothetical protein